MAQTEQISVTASGRWEQCDHCQAPLDERQRYCVVCGARRPHADDPVARYFASAARRTRRPAAAPQAARPAAKQGGYRTAVILALIPIVAAIGVAVGRGSDDGQDALLQALEAQKAPVVNVNGGGGGGSGGDDSADEKSKSSDDKGTDPADGEVIGRGAYGTARKLTGAKVTPEQLQESKKAIKRIVENKGKEYVEQQRGLPDQIVIP